MTFPHVTVNEILEKSCPDELIPPKTRLKVERRSCSSDNFIKVRIPLPSSSQILFVLIRENSLLNTTKVRTY